VRLALLATGWRPIKMASLHGVPGSHPNRYRPADQFRLELLPRTAVE